MTKENPSSFKIEQNNFQMQSSKFVFQNEQTLKEFYLANSFNNFVSMTDEHFPNDQLHSNTQQAQQHPHHKYRNASFELKQIEMQRTVVMDSQNITPHPQTEIQSKNIGLTEFCQQEIVNNGLQDVLLENSIEICAQAVQPCINKGAIRKVPPISKSISSYNELVENSAKNVATNMEEFVCSICERFIEIGHGIVLKECFHRFCRLCIVDSIEHAASMACPFPIEICNINISDAEVQSLLSPASYNRVVEKMIDRILKEKKVEQVNDLPEIYYLENLEAHNYIENIEPFKCPICLTEIDIGEGVVLKNCLHMFCKECLNKTIEHSDEIIIKCPFMDNLGSCEFFLQDREFRSLASENAIRQQHVKSLKQAELSAADDAYHCKYPDCEGWVIVEQANAGDFICEVCSKKNCLACKVVHEGKTCQQYQDEINPNAKNAREALATEQTVQQLIINQLAMKCPRCGIVVQKTTGCNNMICGACHHNFQWIGRN